MRIILTNDDGFDALGINTVKEILQKYGEVYTFAPLHPQSGKSLHSLKSGNHFCLCVAKNMTDVQLTAYGWRRYQNRR